MMEGPGADSEEKHEPVSDIDTAVVVVGLKALDPEWPIREAIDPDPKCAVEYAAMQLLRYTPAYPQTFDVFVASNQMFLSPQIKFAPRGLDSLQRIPPQRQG